MRASNRGWDVGRLQCRQVFPILLVGLLAGCVNPQVQSTLEHEALKLDTRALQSGGLAFITPSTVTGKEEDKQTLALIFAGVLRRERPDIPCVTLPETLGLVNRDGLADVYKAMYQDYRDTGIFKREILEQIGVVTGARYLGQIKLAGFNRNSENRFGILGLRLIETKQTNIRLFFQVWDSSDGTIVWEGFQELNYAYDTAAEQPVTFKTVVEQTASNLISKMP